jgi:hypothetical protein
LLEGSWEFILDESKGALTYETPETPSGGEVLYIFVDAKTAATNSHRKKCM